MMIMLLITVHFNKLHHHHACVIHQYMLFCTAMRIILHSAIRTRSPL